MHLHLTLICIFSYSDELLSVIALVPVHAQDSWHICRNDQMANFECSNGAVWRSAHSSRCRIVDSLEIFLISEKKVAF